MPIRSISIDKALQLKDESRLINSYIFLTMSPKLILTPLGLELKYLIQSLESRGHLFQKIKVGQRDAYSNAELNWVLAIGGHGKTQFALHTQKLLFDLKNVSAVFCVGSAGGIGHQLKTLDIVVGEKTIEHDYRLKFIKKEDPEFKADHRLLENFRNFKSNHFQTHFGIIASGDEDITDNKRAQEIFHQTQALAVAWEGAGGARACLLNNIPYLELRGITDLCSNTTPIDFKNHLRQTMDHLCEALLHAK